MTGVFPTMLNKKATLMSSFTRSDLIVVGSSYMTMSLLHISGIPALIVIAAIIFCLKFIQRNFQLGFFRHLNDPRTIDWSYKL